MGAERKCNQRFQSKLIRAGSYGGKNQISCLTQGELALPTAGNNSRYRIRFNSFGYLMRSLISESFFFLHSLDMVKLATRRSAVTRRTHDKVIRDPSACLDYGADHNFSPQDYARTSPHWFNCLRKQPRFQNLPYLSSYGKSEKAESF
ncbi:hypothetical protein RRG08_010362 [Elysia crispata]|uniref:Uncharacterized protein n=1 Tax=Elysia crispata TaxID=231223 RepID=A0AAE1D924_9GAST|nr:hypothetical protein RRG08_010362 [Elysia crispata]